jgi:hypothetical protein
MSESNTEALSEMIYDAKENILSIRYPNPITIDNKGIIDRLATQALDKLRAIGRPVYALIDDSNVRFDLQLLEYYNQAFAPTEQYIRARTRYGHFDPWTKTAVSLRAFDQRSSLNAHPTREAALEALRAIIAADRKRDGQR